MCGRGLFDEFFLHHSFGPRTLTVLNGHKKEKAHFARDLAVVVLGLKPAFDAAKVAGGKEKVNGEFFDSFTELSVTKVIEVAFEALPGECA